MSSTPIADAIERAVDAFNEQIKFLTSENERLWELVKREGASVRRLETALREVRLIINPIGSWATIAEAVPMVTNAIDVIEAALAGTADFPYTEVGTCINHGPWRRTSGTGCPGCEIPTDTNTAGP